MKDVFHRFVVQRLKFWFAVVGLLGPVLFAFRAYLPSNSGEVASWVQGIGTILAVAAASWIARDQFDWQQRAEAKRRAHEQFVELDVIRDTLSELARLARAAHAAAGGTPDAFRVFYRTKGGAFDELALSALVGLLGRAPLDAAHGPALHIEMRKASFAAGGLVRLCDVFRKTADAIPERHHVDGLHIVAMANHRAALERALDQFETAIQALPKH